MTTSGPERDRRRAPVDTPDVAETAATPHLRVVPDDPGAAAPPPDGYRRALSDRRHRLGLVGLVLVVAVAAGLFLVWRAGNADPDDRADHQGAPPARGTDAPPSSEPVPSTAPGPTPAPTVPTGEESTPPSDVATSPGPAPPGEAPVEAPTPPAGAPVLPLGKPPSVSQLRVTATGATLTWDFAFDDRGAGAASCAVLANGDVVWEGSCPSPRVSGSFVGDYDTRYDVSARATNPNGSDSTLPASLRTPTPTVSITRGAPTHVDTCWHSSCRYIAVTLAGFSPGVDVTVTCVDGATGQGPFKTLTFRTTAQGSGTLSPCYFGFPGRPVWVEVEGFKSNLITW